ncbi:MAG: threonine aldolase family protein [Immundisolibacterales bacterium]|nr:threonine aldolase family protein [Immundisolibacterales bacterium]
MINLYSDTQTLPTEAMREAMARAPVGDEQRMEDPSVNRLCETVADLLGKEAAVFLPSGTMCNELAIRVHCTAGDEIIADRTAHIVHFEGGAPAALSGVMIAPLDGERGVFSGEQARAAVRDPANRYAPRTRLLAVEQTANLGGGTVWPVDALRAVVAVAREHGLATHMDGARMLNAAVASGVPARTIADGFDTVWIDLSKGLGCPVGAVLATSRDRLDDVWRWKQRLGGAMRQAGILAAAGIHAFEHHVERLADDHRLARRFAEGVAGIEGLDIDLDAAETNIVYFRLAETAEGSAKDVVAALAERGVSIGALGPRLLRAVTHLDVDAADVDAALEALRGVMADAPDRPRSGA